MSFWIDIKGHPNYKINSEYLPRVGELFTLGPDTFVGQEDDLTYRVVGVKHRIELGILAEESPLVMLESYIEKKPPIKQV